MADNYGVLSDNSWSDSMTENCGAGATSYWEMAAACSAPGSSKSEFATMQPNDGEWWRWDMHFTNLPDNLIYNGCYNDGNYRPEPYNFRWEIGIGSGETVNEVWLAFPEPDNGDSDSTNSEKDFPIDLVGAVSSNVYVNLATAVGKYLISGSSTRVKDYNNEEWTFDIDVEGDYTDLPQEKNDEAHACQVKLQVYNDSDSGDHYVTYLPEYTFRYPSMDPLDCDCGGFYWYTKTSVADTTSLARYDVA